MTSSYFVSKNSLSQKNLRIYISRALTILEKFWWSNQKPYNRKTPISSFSIPKKGKKLDKILEDVGANIIAGGVNTAHPKTIAHMHCLPVLPSIIAELLIGATNQSLDSWDESPAATFVEQAIIRTFCDLVGYGKNSDGVVDSGGTMSNQAAVFIARDFFIKKYFSTDSKLKGIPPKALNKLKILCSEQAHFSIEKAAAICGLGTNSVVKIPVTKSLTMDEGLLEKVLIKERTKGNYPFMVVATAGTTNAGNIPDLRKIAKICKKFKIWYHVDAAYGGGLLLSSKYRSLLKGIELADSITIDPHKFLYQPISCSVFLLANKNNFKFLNFHSEYLNPKSDIKKGTINLVAKSLQTTKRFDALKLYISFLYLGKKGYNEIITGTIDKAKRFVRIIRSQKDFELATTPQTNILLFRYIRKSAKKLDELNSLNTAIQDFMYKNGKGILSKTKVDGKVFLKATCMNPLTSGKDFSEIIRDIINFVVKRKR